MAKWLLKEFKQIKQAVDKRGLEGALPTSLSLPTTVLSLFVASLSSHGMDKKLPSNGFTGFTELLSILETLFVGVAMKAAPSVDGQEVIRLLLLSLSSCTTVVAMLPSSAQLETLLEWMTETIHSILVPKKSMSIGAVGLLNLAFCFLNDLIYLSVAPTVISSTASTWIGTVDSYIKTLSDATAVDVKAWLTSVSPVLCKLAVTLSGVNGTFAEALSQLLSTLTDTMSDAGLDGSSPVCLEVTKCAAIVSKTVLVES